MPSIQVRADCTMRNIYTREAAFRRKITVGYSVARENETYFFDRKEVLLRKGDETYFFDRTFSHRLYVLCSHGAANVAKHSSLFRSRNDCLHYVSVAKVIVALSLMTRISICRSVLHLHGSLHCHRMVPSSGSSIL